MKRLAISVEGPTEREFVSRVLRPHLAQNGWGVVKPVVINGSVSINRCRDELRRLCQQFDWVTTLYDLYGFQGRDNRNADEMQAALLHTLGQVTNCIPYIQSMNLRHCCLPVPQH